MNAFVRGADAKMILWRSNQCRLIAWLCSLCVRHAKFLLEFKQCLCAPILHWFTVFRAMWRDVYTYSYTENYHMWDGANMPISLNLIKWLQPPLPNPIASHTYIFSEFDLCRYDMVLIVLCHCSRYICTLSVCICIRGSWNCIILGRYLAWIVKRLQPEFWSCSGYVSSMSVVTSLYCMTTPFAHFASRLLPHNGYMIFCMCTMRMH